MGELLPASSVTMTEHWDLVTDVRVIRATSDSIVKTLSYV